MFLALVAVSLTAPAWVEGWEPIPRKKLHITGDHDYPPYCFVDQGIPSGFDVDLIREVARALDLDITIELKAWSEARNDLEIGRADVILGMARIPARESLYAFSTPTKKLSFDIFVAQSSPIRTLDDARSARLLVQRAGVMYDMIRQQNLLTNIVPIADAPEAIRLIAAGAYDGVVMNRVQALYLLNRDGLDAMRALRVSLPTIPYAFAARAGESELIDLLNEGLSIIKAEGLYDSIYEKWFGVYEETRHREWIRYSLFAAAAALVIMALLALINQSLRRTVQRRTEELRTVINLIPHLIFARDRDGLYVMANQAAADSMGVKLEDLIGRKHSDLFPDDPRTEMYLREDRNVIDSGQSVFIPELDYVNQVGVKRIIQLSKIPFRRHDQRPTASLCVAVDITDLKNAEAVVRSSRENLVAILNAIGDGVIAIDAGQAVRRINPVALTMTGWPEIEALGRPVADILQLANPEGDTQPVSEWIRRALSEGESSGFSRHVAVLSRDGSQFDVTVQWSPIRGERGHVAGLVLVLRDVTEENRFNQRMQEIQKMESIGRLAGGVAHDFNNLLTGIIGYTELMGLSLPEHAESRTYLKGVLEASERARDLVQQLLTFSRRHPGEIKPVNLHTLIGHVCSLLQHTLDRRITIVRHARAGRPVTMGDRSQLQNAMLNLGVNARDAMPGGGTLSFATDNREITREDCERSPFAIEPGTYVILQVTDTGVGMDKETLAHIFEPFYTTKGKSGGVGLGLAAVYGTVIEHRGYIEVTSHPGQGSCFEIGLPAHSGPAPDEDESSGKTDTGGQGTILVVDDEPIVLKTLHDILMSLGYRILTAKNGREAIATYQAHGKDIDLVVLDMIMPDINGEETFHELRRLNDQVRVIVCSGYLQDYHVNELLALGILDVIHKPFRKTTLAAKVAEGLRRAPPGPTASA
ncbi:MAG TPA: transporter substrate-binding domain-containing protein [Kiritimatiellia bacterium]|nr:transporter substrate-binding domain-containing protein [Kiritimatiellia bacterium]